MVSGYTQVHKRNFFYGTVNGTLLFSLFFLTSLP